MAEAAFDVIAVGEIMGLLDPEKSGPLEDNTGFRLRIAGAEGNVLINLAHLGHRTGLVSAVGADPFGRLITRTLADQGVGTEHVLTDHCAPTGVFFKERLGDGHRRVYYYRDGSAAAQLSPEAVDLDRVGVPRVLTVSGVTLGLGDGAGLSQVARKAMAWAHDQPGCHVVFDPNLRPRLWDGPRARREFAELLPLIDVVLAGRDELATLFPGRDPDAAARELAMSAVDAVVLKDGARGATVFQPEGTTRIEPYPIDGVIDPVGAGDAFAAGVISGLLHGWSVQDGARIGAVLGARAVTVSGDWEAVRPGDDAGTILEQYTSVFVR
jgi:2-dehydro-3-deoxygluconokinase